MAALALEVQTDGLWQVQVQMDVRTMLMVGVVFVVVADADTGGIVVIVPVRMVMQVFVFEGLPVRVLCVWNFLCFHRP